MKLLKKLFHFFGSVQFAICLIGVTALFVIAGTFIESKTGSHLFAAYYTYQNPAFLALLGFFFINILFAALRRWPFKPRHIPFLITHLGLLMILAGVIVKTSFGTQGTMAILEGSGNNEILIPNSYVVKIQKKNGGTPSDYTLNSRKSPYSELKIQTVEYWPHSTEQTETWIKGDQGIIVGLKPFKVHTLENHEQTSFPLSGRIMLFSPPSEPWNLAAFQSKNADQIIKNAYLEGLKVKIQKSLSNEILYTGFLKDSLQTPLQWKNGQAALQLVWKDANDIYLTADIKYNLKEASIHIPLTGSDALTNQQTSAPYMGDFPLSIYLERTPTLVLTKDLTKEDTHLFAFDAHGRIYGAPYLAKGLSSLMVYDEGWGGYFAHAAIPFTEKQGSRIENEKASVALLIEELKAALNSDKTLSPPLQLLSNACQKANIDFTECFVEYLSYWNKSYSWLYPPEAPSPPLFAQASAYFDWAQESPGTKKTCAWVSGCFANIDPLLQQQIPPRVILEKLKWPLPLPEDSTDEQLLAAITQQMISVGELLPSNNEFASDARLLSAYLRAYGIYPSAILQREQLPIHVDECISLECPMTIAYRSAAIPQKWEEAKPLVKLKLEKEGKTEYIALSYDHTAGGFYWPALNGEYMLRFQPRTQTIPYRIRLRNARQINYPHSTQPFSYESDLLVTHTNTNHKEEKTISMNHVLETWDGFRFYLAGISPQSESGIKRIQLVINHDPVKYWLTYPGGATLALGILLLFRAISKRSSSH